MKRLHWEKETTWQVSESLVEINEYLFMNAKEDEDITKTLNFIILSFKWRDWMKDHISNFKK